jgi:hypothetical protein
LGQQGAGQVPLGWIGEDSRLTLYGIHASASLVLGGTQNVREYEMYKYLIVYRIKHQIIRCKRYINPYYQLIIRNYPQFVKIRKYIIMQLTL